MPRTLQRRLVASSVLLAAAFPVPTVLEIDLRDGADRPARALRCQELRGDPSNDLMIPLDPFGDGFDARSAAGLGVEQFVSPVNVRTKIGRLQPVPVFTRLTLTYTPEPGTLTLAAAGMAGLALLGRRRRQRGNVR